MLALLFLLTACRAETAITSTSTPVPEVIVTAWTAEVVGELVNVDGCLRIRDEKGGMDYALLWPPDVMPMIESDRVRVISGVVSGNRREVILNFGDDVYISGGETDHPDEQLLQHLPPSCKGPYWVVGFEITPIHPTGEP